MTIQNFYTTPFYTKRLKDDQSAYEDYLTGKYCHIQQSEGEPVELDDGAFYILYDMWCDIMDIQVGDQVITSSNTYQVKEVKTFDMGGNPHMEIVLALPI